MSLDILAALEASQGGRPGETCLIQRWLDGIPTDAPGKQALEATLTELDQGSPNWRTLEELDAILRRLGLKSSIKTIGNHRARRCRCFL